MPAALAKLAVGLAGKIGEQSPTDAAMLVFRADCDRDFGAFHGWIGRQHGAGDEDIAIEGQEILRPLMVNSS